MIKGSSTGTDRPSADDVYKAIGALVCAFSNNESVLVVLIQKLLITDRAGAILVFGTLNTTRARVDLTRRLARGRLADRPDLLDETEGLLTGFEKATRFRNDILHSMFVYDPNGEGIVETQTMRIDERKGNVAYGKTRPMDNERVAAIMRETKRLNIWNQAMWAHIAAIDGSPSCSVSVSRDEPSDVVSKTDDLRP